MKPEINPHKIVIFTGAGISTQSGIPCFTGNNGLWEKNKIVDVCTKRGFEKNPMLVTEFYNKLKKTISSAKPNAAHTAIADLEKHFDVIVITTNLDSLHERAGSTKVIHLHGNLQYGKSHTNQNDKVFIGERSIDIGEMYDGMQLRHDVVFYGEFPENISEAKSQIKTASKVLVVGSSLSVSPANTIIKHSRFHAEKIIVDISRTKAPFGFRTHQGEATNIVPLLCKQWVSSVK